MVCRFILSIIFLLSVQTDAATIAIVDTGFDLDHDFLQPKILNRETDEEGHHPDLIKEFHGWDFHDNSHLKEAVIKDPTILQEILRFRNLRAKGHGQGLTFDEFEWFKKKSSDRFFMEKVRSFKRHSHGTFVAGIALREGENINIFPIRGLNIPTPVLMVEDNSPSSRDPLRSKNPEEKFKEEVRNSYRRVTRKFSKICRYLSMNKVNVVNASYGITYKNILTKFRESYREITGSEISEVKLKTYVDDYFSDLYRAGLRTIKRYPEMLFVFSAGNSSLDNDQFHHYPSRIKLPNTITVAAMNGDYIASFSNYGLKNVDVGAPGVAIPSIVPKVYSADTGAMYSPSSGTSMAAPYISNIAAQVMNTNPALRPPEVKKIILETGDEKIQLKTRLASGSIVNNEKAIKAALLSKDMPLQEAIDLAKLGLIPMEDSVQFGGLKAKESKKLEEKILDSVPQVIPPVEVDEELLEVIPTKSESSPQTGQEREQRDNSAPPSLSPPSEKALPVDPAPANPTSEQSPPPSEVSPASSSQSQSEPGPAQSQGPSPSSPQ